MTSGRIRFAAPAIAVMDTLDLIAYYRPPGTTSMVTAGAKVTTSRRDRELALRAELHRQDWDLVEHVSPRPVGTLVVARPEDWFSTSLRPDGDGAYQPEYVNIETPHRRSPIGFDLDDLCLDIAVHADLAWTLEDGDDLDERQVEGIYTAELTARIRAAANTAIVAIERREPPFDGSWSGWRPDPAWPVPVLGTDWDRYV